MTGEPGGPVAPAASEGLEVSEPDRRELLRIARVYAREFLRSGRRPPGVPHRASLLAPAAAWLRMRGPVDDRAAARLTSDRAVYSAIAELAVQLVQRAPPLQAGELALTRFEVVAVTAWERVGDPATVEPGRHHLLVSTPSGCVLLPAEESASEAGGLAAVELACRRAGLEPDAWRDPDVRVDAGLGTRFCDPEPEPG